jgi:hypothetical protein
MDTPLSQVVNELRSRALSILSECDELDKVIKRAGRSFVGQGIAKGTSAGAQAPAGKPKVRRELSPSARKRISMAQKKRWREHKRQKALKAKTA